MTQVGSVTAYSCDANPTVECSIIRVSTLHAVGCVEERLLTVPRAYSRDRGKQARAYCCRGLDNGCTIVGRKV